MGSCAAPSAKGDDKFITTDYLQQCPQALQLHAQGAVWEGENRHFLKKMLNKLESYLLILK